MPHMKYFQSICRMKDHFQEAINDLQRKNGRFEQVKELYNENNIDELEEELLALKYLRSLQFGLAHHEKENLIKPTVDVMNRCLNRYLQYIEKVFGVKQNTLKEKRERFPFTVKEYQACKHYLFQFTKRIWYEKLPEEILTFENKYGKRS